MKLALMLDKLVVRGRVELPNSAFQADARP